MRCDKRKPSCQRCSQVGAPCSFQTIFSPPSTSSSPENVQESQSDGFISASGHPASPIISDQSNLEAPPPAASSSTAKKRQRACLSCVRCHRLKVKCDKKQPCTRCRQSGFAPQCAYTHRIDIVPQQRREAGFEELTIDDKNPHDVATSWQCRARGASHWKELLNKVCMTINVVRAWKPWH